MELPDLTTYHVLHRGMRLDSARLAGAVAALGEDERSVRGPALARWYAGYYGELHEHHTVEDEIFFPALVERVPVFDGQIDRIDAEHDRLEDVLVETRARLGRLSDPGVPWPVAVAEASEITAELRDLLDVHLGFEDADVLPLFVRHFTREDYEDLGERALKHTKLRHLVFAIPWAAEAATEDQFRHMYANAPLAFKLLWRATRRRYNRMAQEAFGSALRPAA
ncbi:MAG TPA: hemerythrin domain-containing protein [Acidimicrobiales bacterium]|nr:hemerythrin domain-containing protein [Acidimicrobiales bacterium]